MKNEVSRIKQGKRRMQALEKRIEKAYENAAQSYIVIGTAIMEIRDKELYKIDGYNNTYEYCKDKFDISTGTVHNYEKVVGRFCNKTESGEYILDEKWSEYKKSQLTVMAGMTDEQMKKVEPNMSVRQIKKMIEEDLKKLKDKKSHETEKEEVEVIEEEEQTETKEQKSKTIVLTDEAEFNEEIIGIIFDMLNKGHKVEIKEVYVYM